MAGAMGQVDIKAQVLKQLFLRKVMSIFPKQQYYHGARIVSVL